MNQCRAQRQRDGSLGEQIGLGVRMCGVRYNAWHRDSSRFPYWFCSGASGAALLILLLIEQQIMIIIINIWLSGMFSHLHTRDPRLRWLTVRSLVTDSKLRCLFWSTNPVVLKQEFNVTPAWRNHWFRMDLKCILFDIQTIWCWTHQLLSPA